MGDKADDAGVVTTVARVVNLGPDPARQVQLDDVIEHDGVLVDATPNRGTCSAAPDDRRHPQLGGLAAGASAEVVLRVKVDKLSVPKERGRSARRNVRAQSAAQRPEPVPASRRGNPRGSTRRSSASSATRDPDTSNNAAAKTTKSKCIGRLRAGQVMLRAGCSRRAAENLWVAKSFRPTTGSRCGLPASSP